MLLPICMQAQTLAAQMEGTGEPMDVVPVASNSSAAGTVPLHEGRVQKFDRLLQALHDARAQARTAMKGGGGVEGA